MARQLVSGFAGFLIAAALLTGAAAGPNPADGRKIDACLKAGSEKGASGVACIGIVADPCIDAVREKETGPKDAVACAARELAIWTARLQRAVQSASKGGGKSVATAVAASQKSFAELVAKLCPQLENLEPGHGDGRLHLLPAAGDRDARARDRTAS